MCDHGDAIDMELTSRFGKRGKETRYLNRLRTIGSRWNQTGEEGVEVIYPVIPSRQFRDIATSVACKLRAAWTLPAKPKLWES